jgi:hypothetical protein
MPRAYHRIGEAQSRPSSQTFLRVQAPLVAVDRAASPQILNQLAAILMTGANELREIRLCSSAQPKTVLPAVIQFFRTVLAERLSVRLLIHSCYGVMERALLSLKCVVIAANT